MIYGLINKNTGELRYVGKTRDKLRDRLYEHIHEAITKKEGNPKSKWMRKIGKENVEIVPLEETENESSDELWWMDYMRFLGCDLLNVVDYEMGGSYGMALPEDEKDKIIEEYKNPSVRVSEIKNKYDISQRSLNRLRRRRGVKYVYREPANQITVDEKEREFIVKKYKQEYWTIQQLSNEIEYSHTVIKRILNEENVERYTRKDRIEAGKLDPTPPNKLSISEKTKNKVLDVYNETKNLRKACREADIEDHYHTVRNRINNEVWKV